MLQSLSSTVTRGAKVIAERDVDVGGRGGREIVVEKFAGQALVTVRMCLCSNRLYTISVVVPAKQPFKDQTTQFLDSFALLP